MMTERMLNHTTPTMRPARAREAIALRRGASVRMISVMGVPSARAPDGLDGAVHIVDRERMLHCVVVVERHDELDRELRDQDQATVKLLPRPVRLADHGDREGGDRDRLRRYRHG